MTDGSSIQAPGTTVGERPIEAEGLSRRFGAVRALRDVSLRVERGEVHALLGPNGAGKTTLLRILTGLVDPDEGRLRILGIDPIGGAAQYVKRLVAVVPSGDRTFYLRISGLENLVFFGRLLGLPRSRAAERAWECLAAVGLTDAAKGRVGVYSHGMQKRLAVARALMADPPILLVDEATHDLDPQGARTVQGLVTGAVERGAAVVWATQRVDEIRGFADRVTFLDRGAVRFCGSVPQLMAVSITQRFAVHLRARDRGLDVLSVARDVVRSMGVVDPLSGEDREHLVLSLREGVILGDALAALTASGVQVLACRDERSGLEEAFLRLASKETS